MGLFVYFRGSFECVRCRKTSDACIQTKLLRSEVDNCSREYCVGDSELMDGLEDYCPLYPWDCSSPLVVVVGDWGCAHCGLAWQWSKVVFDVAYPGAGLVGTIRELSDLHPLRADDLARVHFVEAELAVYLSGLWEQSFRNWREGFAKWQACSVEERCERVAAGFRQWCVEVAGVDVSV